MLLSTIQGIGLNKTIKTYRNILLTMTSMFMFSALLLSNGGCDYPLLTSPFIPDEWEKVIITPIIEVTLDRVMVGPAASGVAGHTDIVIRYTITNSDKVESVENFQVNFDLINQIGVPPFVSTGSLTGLTGSGTSSFLTSLPFDSSGGTLNEFYNGSSNSLFFGDLPKLGPNSYLTVDIPVELSDTNVHDLIVINSTTTAFTANGELIDIPPSQLEFLQPCQSESLACVGTVNVSVGPDCKAEVGLDAVFLNGNPDPNRFIVEVFIGNTIYGSTLDHSLIGQPLEYRVIDLCVGGEPDCWGRINLENKNLPSPSSTNQEIYCGEDPDPLETLQQITLRLENGCYVDLENYQEFFTSRGDKCDTSFTFRNVTASYNIDGWQNSITIHRDTIIALPINIDSAVGPLGNTFEYAIEIECSDFPFDGAPQPSYIENYIRSKTGHQDSALISAYPYINKGEISVPIITNKDSIIETRRLDTVLIDGRTVIVTVVDKDTVIVADTSYLVQEDIVPIKVGSICNLSTSFKDESFDGCAGENTKVKRTWRLLNWCTGKDEIFEQWIVIKDKTAPEILYTDSLTVYEQPWSCVTSFNLTPTIIDDCGEIGSINYVPSAGQVEGNVLTNISSADSPVQILISASDGCGNTSSRTMTLFVNDNNAPVAITKDTINTTIVYDVSSDMGIGKITAESIDQGSHDSDCGRISRCILLEEELSNPILLNNGEQAMDDEGNPIYRAFQCAHDGVFRGTPYVICKDDVKFCCSDVGFQRVVLVVSDGSTYSTNAINYTTVKVEDKSSALLQCTSIEISCGTLTHPDDIGYPDIAYGICSVEDITYQDRNELNDCGQGTIFRDWYVDGDRSCTQTITVVSGDSFDPKSIKWPQHFDGSIHQGYTRTCIQDTISEEFEEISMADAVSCSQDLDTGVPIWCPRSNCSMLVASYEDLTVHDNDVCKKIIRTWTVIDWCIYQPNQGGTDVDKDQFTAIDDSRINTSNLLSDLDDGDQCISCDKQNDGYDPAVFLRYTDVDVDGFYNYEQVIQIKDETGPIISVDQETDIDITDGAQFKGDTFEQCNGTASIRATVSDLCGSTPIDASMSSWIVRTYRLEDTVLIDEQNYVGDSIQVDIQGNPQSGRMVVWEVSDGCSNSSKDTTIITYHDALAPTPLCISDISTTTTDGASGNTIIWASEYSTGSFDNCGAITYFFIDEDGTLSSSKELGCGDIEDGVSEVIEYEIVVVDEAGNTSEPCNVTIRIDDNANVCPDTAESQLVTISGRIMTPLSNPVQDVQVSLNDNMSMITSVAGTFAFSNLPVDQDYRVTSIKDADDINGITALDLLLLQRHVLGSEKLNDGYKSIAADVNGDQRVSALDLVEVKRLILGSIDDFDNNDSWRFTDASQDFEDENYPWPFVESIYIDSVNGNMFDLELIAIKIGDIDNSAIANDEMADTRSGNDYEISINNVFLKKGEQGTIALEFKNDSELKAIQLEISSSEIDIHGIYSNEIDLTQGDLRIEQGVLTIAKAFEDQRIQEDFSILIDVTSKQNQYTNEMIAINSERINSLVVDASLEQRPIHLDFYDSKIDDGLQLFQNDPNPFTNFTDIHFVLPHSGKVELSIFDINGRLLIKQTPTLEKGAHTWTVNKSELQHSGVLYYRVGDAVQTITKKMILID